jgi:hypothetical protein
MSENSTYSIRVDKSSLSMEFSLIELTLIDYVIRKPEFSFSFFPTILSWPFIAGF